VDKLDTTSELEINSEVVSEFNIEFLFKSIDALLLEVVYNGVIRSNEEIFVDVNISNWLLFIDVDNEDINSFVGVDTNDIESLVSDVIVDKLTV